MALLAPSSLVLGLASAAVLPRAGDHYPEKHGSKHNHTKLNVQVGDRPYFLIDDMDEGSLKDKLESCSEGPFAPSDFVFAHRGASLQYPEHTYAAYSAARRQGAGVIECDVAFTKDKQLVCRHAQCDLHTTTNILNTTLASKCTTPFTPANSTALASAKCCTSDLTLAEYQTLCGKQDGFNPNGTTVKQYMDGTPYFRTDLYSSGCPKIVTLDEYIDIVDGWNLKFTAELKTPEVPMPFDGYTQEQYAQDMIDAFKSKGIAPERVWPQSFLPSDIFYWIDNEPEFGKQAVYLDERVDTPAGYENATASLPALAARGVKIMAPAMFALTKVDNATGQIVPSEYAIAAKENNLEIVAWSFERSGWLQIGGGGYYYDYVKSVINKDGDMYTVLDVLARQVGIKAMFSDWPATVTYYASCFGL
ncbi:glycerophosphoryl diester phosphodiesterase family protein [Didymella exigua CBS 183.55]|uniref:glycerophosphodiester phosphodiesterase n=1 Tax=Didymella exigua CBS 183.55 TaxID=1150837 RepID=A0A6A5RLD7_9PLEO|nr:glycerophosphoryl diester phosphodiesterase family protein [Didymella exigua CBS 183.55]KAF1927794.1 glycerophosphoryl diester phosphodiesterase family protein [Didymella exigua CBS 183.55]